MTRTRLPAPCWSDGPGSSLIDGAFGLVGQVHPVPIGRSEILDRVHDHAFLITVSQSSPFTGKTRTIRVSHDNSVGGNVENIIWYSLR